MVDLSDEIWQRVLSHLRLTVASSHDQWVDFNSERARLRALASACLASRRFCRLARPLLYQRLPELIFSRPALRGTLAERPDLAGFVQHVHFGESYMEEESVRRDVDAAMRTCPSAREQVRALQRSLRDGTGDAQDIAVAVFILLMRNLERLSITVLDQYEHTARMVGSSAMPPGNPSISGRVGDETSDDRPLSRLRVLTLSHWEGKGAVPMIDLWGVLKPPTLERFQGYSIRACLWRLEQPPPPFANPNLKEVQLLYSLVDAEGLEAILRLLPGLRRLRIAWGPPTVGDCDELDLGQMGRVLREGARALEVLDLDFRESFNYEQEEARGRLGPLRELAGLKVLRVQPTVLVGDVESDWPDSDSRDDHNAPPLPLVDALPEQLEHLCLYQGALETEWTEEDAKALLGNERLPRLRTAVLR